MQVSGQIFWLAGSAAQVEGEDRVHLLRGESPLAASLVVLGQRSRLYDEVAGRRRMLRNACSMASGHGFRQASGRHVVRWPFWGKVGILARANRDPPSW